MAAKKIKIFLCVFYVFFVFRAGIFPQTNRPSVIPLPNKYTFLPGHIFLQENSFAVKKYFAESEPVSIALEEADSVYSKIFGKKLFSGNGKYELMLGIPSGNKRFREICKKYNLIPGDSIGHEGYKMLVDSSRIIIAANSDKGIFYGIQTLKQMIKGSGANKIVRCVRISDYPKFKYRAVMDDVSRGPIPTIEYVKYQIRRLAEMKINMFMQYTEHIVKTKSHPEFAPEDGSYSIDELKELSDYAEKYNVIFVGGFQSFGHFENILKTPGYSHLGEMGTLISPVKEESYSFLRDVYGEMIPAFKSPFFHIDCDETFDLGKGQSKQLVDSIGYGEVYLRHVLKLNEIVEKYNVRSMVWGDIFLQYPELIPRIPKDMIIGTWVYDPLDSFEKYITPFKNAGLDIFVVPGVLNSSKIFPDIDQSYVNIRNFALDGVKYGAFGILTTVWDDGGAAFFGNDWLGTSYAAEQSWNPNSLDFVDFETRLNTGVYGSDNNNFTSAIHSLTQIKNFEPTDGLNDKILFENLIPAKGKSIKISLIDWDEADKIVDESVKLSGKTILKFYTGDIDYLSFTQKLYKFLGNKRAGIITAADKYREALKLFEINKPVSRKLIVQAISGINKLVLEEISIRDLYEGLWLKENHTYALDRIIKKYNYEIEQLKNIHQNLIESLSLLDSSKNPLPISEVQLDVSKLPGKYFREWLMINPLPNSDKQIPSQIDYLEKMGGELNAVPKVTEENYFNGIKYRWKRVISDYSDVVNLKEIFNDDTASVVYAFANIDSETDTTVNALIGCTEGAAVIINGAKVYEIKNNILNPDQFGFDLPLKKGKNNLMLKISTAGKEFGFTFRLPGSTVRNKKNRYKIIEAVNE